MPRRHTAWKWNKGLGICPWRRPQFQNVLPQACNGANKNLYAGSICEGSRTALTVESDRS